VVLSPDGGSAEVAIIGAEGLVGSQLLFAGGAPAASYTRVVAQFPGTALAVRGAVVAREFERSERLRAQVQHFVVGLMHQITQCVLCNRLHRAEQRYCRWLLMSADLMASDSLSITQELMAEMMGMRRETVTLLTNSLQGQGMIRHERGQVEISKRALLTSMACECYGAVKREYIRLGLLPAGRRCCWRIP
jgi:CRP-like cAMP-binding protein